MSDFTITALLAGVFQLAGLLFFALDTFRGGMQPSTTSFGIWTVVSFSLLASSFAAGADSNLPFILAGTLGTTLVFVLSFKFGYRKWSWVDPIALILALISLGAWLTTRQAAYAVYILTLIDWIAVLPIFRKSWVDPDSESRKAWFCTLIGSVFLVAAIGEWQWVVAVVAITQLLHAVVVNILIRWPHPNNLKLEASK